jgi:signal transduction histidine kinase
MFRPDNVRKTEGTGLGLYAAKSVIDLAGGRIWFESEEGQGTSFHFTFPLAGMRKKAGTTQLT